MIQLASRTSGFDCGKLCHVLAILSGIISPTCSTMLPGFTTPKRCSTRKILIILHRSPSIISNWQPASVLAKWDAFSNGRCSPLERNVKHRSYETAWLRGATPSSVSEMLKVSSRHCSRRGLSRVRQTVPYSRAIASPKLMGEAEFRTVDEMKHHGL